MKNKSASATKAIQPILFTPSFINLRVELNINGRDDDNYGASELSVLMEALSAYKETVSGWYDCNDTVLTLELIEELQLSLLDAMYTRLSKSSKILHKLKHNLS